MEINKAALENKIILYRYEQRLCSERVRFSFAFVVCSVLLNSEQSQMVQDENDCREININKTNQKRRRVVRATISRVLARLASLASTRSSCRSLSDKKNITRESSTTYCMMNNKLVASWTV